MCAFFGSIKDKKKEEIIKGKTSEFRQTIVPEIEDKQKTISMNIEESYSYFLNKVSEKLNKLNKIVINKIENILSVIFIFKAKLKD